MRAAAQNPLISKAYGIIKTLSLDEEARLLAQSREKALRDAWNREEGARKDQALESAKIMLKTGKLGFPELLSYFAILKYQDLERLQAEIYA